MRIKSSVVTSALLLTTLLAAAPAARGADVSDNAQVQTEPQAQAPAVVEGIRTEAMRPNNDPAGRPLPLAASWNGNHWKPRYQVQMIRQGHHILPWMKEPHNSPELSDEQIEQYKNSDLGKALQTFAKWHLPLTVGDGNYTGPLHAKKYGEMPPEKSPWTLKPDGTLWKRPSPFAAVEPWREIGREKMNNPRIKVLQQIYPDPPRVIFLSNNEARKLRWHGADQSKRFLDQFGQNASDDQKREAFAKGWKTHFDAMFDAMRGALVSDGWRENSLFMGYETFGPPFYGRWGGWPRYAMPVPQTIDPQPAWWGGGTASIYDNDWEKQKSDYNVWSPQIEAMNMPFMVKDAIQINPDFWFEISVWDGNKDWWTANPKGQEYRPKKVAKPAQYRAKGQDWSPERYAGWTQYVLWTARPRVMRMFRGWSQPRQPVVDDRGKQLFTGFQPYWDAQVANVDRVWNSDLLTRFWRQGELVPNPHGKNPWDHNLLAKYKTADRWFRLDTSIDPPRPWKNTTNLKVYALAYVLGSGDSREWLVYAHSPLGDRDSVEVMVPGHGPVTLDIPVAGAFYHIAPGGQVDRVDQK